MHVHFYEGQQKKLQLSSLLFCCTVCLILSLPFSFKTICLIWLLPLPACLTFSLNQWRHSFIQPFSLPPSILPVRHASSQSVCAWPMASVMMGSTSGLIGWFTHCGEAAEEAGGGNGWGQWEADNEMLNGLRRKGKIERDEWFEEIDITLFDWKMEGFI